MVMTPTKLCIEDLITDTQNCTVYFDIKILIALANEKNISIQNSDTTNILHKRQLHVTKQIHRKLVRIINNNKSI